MWTRLARRHFTKRISANVALPHSLYASIATSISSLPFYASQSSTLIPMNAFFLLPQLSLLLVRLSTAQASNPFTNLLKEYKGLEWQEDVIRFFDKVTMCDVFVHPQSKTQRLQLHSVCLFARVELALFILYAFPISHFTNVFNIRCNCRPRAAATPVQLTLSCRGVCTKTSERSTSKDDDAIACCCCCAATFETVYVGLFMCGYIP